MSTFDPRVTPARPDLAAEHLRGQVEAARFVAAEVREMVEAQAPLRKAAASDASLVTEVLKGERVAVYEITEEGWCWGQLKADGYVGWLSANALAAPAGEPTHRVTALRTFIFPAPDIKMPPMENAPFGARLAIKRVDRQFAITPQGGFVPLIHLAPLDKFETDFVGVAERFLGTAYLWGGKTNLGIDCSGLLQVALQACGIACPRDSDMQEQALGKSVDPAVDFSNLRRGDLLFWKGHVAIVRDKDVVLHANAHHMAAIAEPLRDAVRRMSEAGTTINSIKRL